jgi:hypothetical protein
MAKAGKQRREERRKAVTRFSVVIRDFLVKTSQDNNSWCAGEGPHVGNLIVFFKKDWLIITPLPFLDRLPV